MDSALLAGAAVVNVTPTRSLFLHGYPHVPRMSTGTHDPLLACALCLVQAGRTSFFVSVDVILIDKALTERVRERIAEATGIEPAGILVSATHTHSGPVIVDYLSNSADPVVPPADAEYREALAEGIVRAGVEAWRARRPAEAAVVQADATGVGTNRHDPAGPSDLRVPVLAVRERQSGRWIGVLLVCAMHPTVLHEDSTLYSGDFPALARQRIQAGLSTECPIIYHTGASGDQSPRHVVRENTFGEADRLGGILATAVLAALRNASFTTDWPLHIGQRRVNLPARRPPRLDEAEAQVVAAHARLKSLQARQAARTEIRTAECDCFGAEETVAIARAAADGRLQAALASCLPAEIQVLRVGSHAFVGWPGEFFVEFAQRIHARHPGSTVITLANGELQGYVVTREAVERKWYEAGNALLQSPEAGDQVVAATLELLDEMNAHG